ncbi:MAG TPA: hypothetical protein VF614_13105 [Chthoniobacteraceae bacterium]|jgi:hypothetical protein
MKPAFLILLHIGVIGLQAAEPENTLQVFAEQYLRTSAEGHPIVAVTAYYKRIGDANVLRFKITNVSDKPLTFATPFLPWSGPPLLTLAALTTDGHRLPNIYPLIHPNPSPEVTLTPGQSRQGDFDLRDAIDFATAPTDKDIILLWSYSSPVDFGQRKPVSTGIAIIPKHK